MFSFFRMVNLINYWASVAAGFITGLISLIVCYGVVARYLLNKPIGWGEEIGTYLMIWAAFLGAGYTMQVNGHIGVDVIVRKLSNRAQYLLSLGKYAVGFAFTAILGIKGIQDCLLSIQMGEKTVGDLSIPVFIPQLALPVGALFLSLQIAEKLLRSLLSRKSHNGNSL